jgi:hypothetical protein
MTEPIHRMPARRGLLPGEHHLDSGYPSAELMSKSPADFGVTLITPLPADPLAPGQGRRRVRPGRVHHRFRP